MLEHYSNEIKDVKEAGFEISVVIGGGNIFRGVRGATEGMDSVQGDYMGKLGTMINSMALQDALKRKDIHTRLMRTIRMEEIAKHTIRRHTISHLKNGQKDLYVIKKSKAEIPETIDNNIRPIAINDKVILKSCTLEGIYEKYPDTH